MIHFSLSYEVVGFRLLALTKDRELVLQFCDPPSNSQEQFSSCKTCLMNGRIWIRYFGMRHAERQLASSSICCATSCMSNLRHANTLVPSTQMPSVTSVRAGIRNAFNSGAFSVAEPRPGHFGRSRSRFEGQAPSPAWMKKDKFLMLFSSFVPTLIKSLKTN